MPTGDELLREQKEWLALLEAAYTTAPMGLAIMDRELRYLTINEALAALNGRPVAEHIGRTLREMVPFAADLAEPVYRRVLETGRPALETALSTSDGAGVRHWIGSAYPLRDLRGAVTAVGCVVREVTEQKRAERDLRESEARFRQLAENIDDVFWLASVDGTEIIYVSPAYREVWGRGEEALYAQPSLFLESVDSRDRDRVRGVMAQQSQVGYDIEYRIVRPNGGTAWIRHRAFPIHDEHGAIYRVAGVASDITARKSLEEQLLQAQKMEGIGRVAGGVAHDFNNLLSVILGYATLASRDLGPDHPVCHALDQVSRAGQRASELPRQLLAFSRQQVLTPKVIDLNQILMGMEPMLRGLLGEDLELLLILSGKLGRVLADPGQIERVIMNLAVNARDAMPRGGKLLIEVSNVELDAAAAAGLGGLGVGPYVLLSVMDTGIGMDAATRARIFEPFFTTKEKGQGTGLGLSTVFGIVKQSGGHISVCSEPGKGTTFKIHLPSSDREPQTTAPNLTPPAPLHGAETLLLVEDEEQVRMVACAILRRHGYRVLEAQNAGEALLIFEREATGIHLLITDVVMPRVSGTELAERLASMRPGLKRLFMSGYTDSPVARHNVLDPGVAFLQKPLTPDLLLMKVREVLDTPFTGR